MTTLTIWLIAFGFNLYLVDQLTEVAMNTLCVSVRFSLMMTNTVHTVSVVGGLIRAVNVTL